MTAFDEFLTDYEPRPWTLPERAPEGFVAVDMFLGRGDNGIEVACAEWSGSTTPAPGKMRSLWSARHGGAASPLLLVAAYTTSEGSRVAVCGPVGEQPPVQLDLDLSQVERIADAALKEPSRHLAIRFLSAVVPEAGGELVGLRNQGMFATHALRSEVRDMPSWTDALSRGKRLLTSRGRELLSGLGFGIEQLDSRANVLTVRGNKRAVAVLLEEHDNFEETSDRFNAATPVSFAMALAERENLPWVVLTRGQQIRVYSARPDVGVGRKGRSETFVEANLALVADDDAGYLPLLFGADALSDGGTFQTLLTASERFAGELGQRLRERVYNEVVPDLALAIAHAHHGADTASLTDDDLEHLYEQTLLVLFRTLFVAYAEDRSLLPYDSNGSYRDNSLKALAQRLARTFDDVEHSFDPAHGDIWNRLRELWTAVDRGHTEWGVPAYNGGLFSTSPDVSRAGADLAAIMLDNAAIGAPLRRLLVDTDSEGAIGALDFRSLSVREFGTIYEGLLESNLSIAPSDLVLDGTSHFVPAPEGAEPTVRQGGVYFHNRSGERKSTGSYFTKPFAVEHLLDSALKPALDRHLDDLKNLLDSGDEPAAAERFFDFRCADLSMGSGHFLVAAVDRIEAGLSDFLATHPISQVTEELHRLRAAALEHLGPHADSVEIETTSLLRRQVARRCIYGVDRNPIAVELARLAIWIHTFVPGLPLSFLDHSLVVGDSLTGIGTLDEIVDELTDGRDRNAKLYVTSFLEPFLERARPALQRLATIEEADRSEIAISRDLHREAEAATQPIRDLCAMLVYSRITDDAEVPPSVTEKKIAEWEWLGAARAADQLLNSTHFPVAFPEVFLRGDNSGFDCILGNPPWDEATVEELAFWALRFPGLRSMTQARQRTELQALRDSRPDLVAEFSREVEKAEQLRKALLAGPYPGMGTGDPDLYKAFGWRFWHLLSARGRTGVVLPRSALSALGMKAWREHITDEGEFYDLTLLTNRGQWVFPEVHPQYTIGLVTFGRARGAVPKVCMRGPYSSHAAYAHGVLQSMAQFDVADFRSWTSTATFPLLPSERSVDVFRKLRAHPRLDAGTDDWVMRPVREFDATNDKPHMIMDPEDTAGLWPVFKGASFDLWKSDTTTYYGWADPDHVKSVLQDRRRRQHNNARSAFNEMSEKSVQDPATLPCLHPRIVFRDITRATDTRTMRCALIPGQVVITNKGPFLLRVRGDERDEAFILGVLSSIPLDWYARRFVETGMNFHILNAFPVPDPGRDKPLRRRVEQTVASLLATDPRFAEWVAAVNGEDDPLEFADREQQLAELDACVSLLYGLDADDVNVIFTTFHQGWDPSSRMAGTLDAMLRHANDAVDLETAGAAT